MVFSSVETSRLPVKWVVAIGVVAAFREELSVA